MMDGLDRGSSLMLILVPDLFNYSCDLSMTVVVQPYQSSLLIMDAKFSRCSKYAMSIAFI